jgi:hypothetical protein
LSPPVKHGLFSRVRVFFDEAEFDKCLKKKSLRGSHTPKAHALV